MTAEKDPIIIVGAGASGIMAARRAGELGGRVLLLERNSRPGVKILISGGGKCNLTHAGSPEELLRAFPRREARFLKPSFFALTGSHVVEMVKRAGVRTYTRPDGRIFPLGGSAKDVLAALLAPLASPASGLHLRTRVTSIVARERSITGVMVGEHFLRSSLVVIATGGASYPQTGTTGDAYGWLRELGHTIIPVHPALAPIAVDPPLPPGWRGVALRNGILSVRSRHRRLCRWRGDILFSHEGVSGPAALEVSRSAARAMQTETVSLEYDLLPDTDSPEVDSLLTGRIASRGSRTVATLLEAHLPNRLISPFLEALGVDPDRRGHALTRRERKAIVERLKVLPLGRVSHIDLARGEVTAGGVSLPEVNPRTMESRIVRGLYITGEVLDVAGPVGGYNLQVAFSTGHAAGEAATQAWLSPPANPSPSLLEE